MFAEILLGGSRRGHFSAYGRPCWAHFSEGPGAGATFLPANVPAGRTNGRFVDPVEKFVTRIVDPAWRRRKEVSRAGKALDALVGHLFCKTPGVAYGFAHDLRRGFTQFEA